MKIMELSLLTWISNERWTFLIFLHIMEVIYMDTKQIFSISRSLQGYQMSYKWTFLTHMNIMEVIYMDIIITNNEHLWRSFSLFTWISNEQWTFFTYMNTMKVLLFIWISINISQLHEHYRIYLHDIKRTMTIFTYMNIMKVNPLFNIISVSITHDIT